MLQKRYMLGVGITNESEEKILKYILTGLKEAKKKIFIVTPNTEMLVYAHKHPDYKDKLNDATIALPDGVGVFLAAVLYGSPFKERIPGVDFIEELCKSLHVGVKNPVNIGFLGGGRGIADLAAHRLREKYPWIKVTFAAEEWNYEPHKSYKTYIDILFVAFGHPKQEEWIHKNLHNLPVTVAMGVGGSLDYLSGTIPRAPYLIRAMGFEWLFRLIRQPWRWKRQLALGEFIYLLLKERFHSFFLR